MTLLAAAVTPRFGLMVADKVASVHGPATLQMGALTYHSAQGFQIYGWQKIWQTDDAVGCVAHAGTATFHQAHMDEGNKRSGLDYDDFVYEKVQALPRFRDLGTCGPIEGLMEQTLHIYQSGERFILTKVEGSILHVLRQSVRSNEANAELLLAGSGMPLATAMFAMPPTAEKWAALRVNKSAGETDFLDILRPVYQAVSAFWDLGVGAEIEAWHVRHGGKWAKLVG